MTGRSTSNRALVAGGVGNVVEWYDFAVYGAFATVIATYFPGADPIAGLSASFAVFATAFLARPVGAVVFGRLGDRVGRRQVLVTVIVPMAAATAVAIAAVAAAVAARETAFQPLDGAEEPETELARPGR
jgi:MFS transporter, MHS family, proline/betaine transporter